MEVEGKEEPGDSIVAPVPPPQMVVPPPPAEGLQALGQGSQDSTVPTLLLDEQKNYEDIVNLLKSGVELNVIANVKNTTLEELMAFMHLKSINLPPHPAVGEEMIAPQDEVHQDQEVPSPLMDKTPDRPKKRKHSWKGHDFPKNKPEDGDYFCADCKKSNKTYHCKGCGRKCWKYCDKCTEPGFYSNHHPCFKKESTKKRRRPWKKKDFPNEKKGVYFCADCDKPNTRRLCDCGRDCWKWCDICNSFFSKHHFPCSYSVRANEDHLGLDPTPQDVGIVEEEEEEVQQVLGDQLMQHELQHEHDKKDDDMEPPLKKRKLD